MAQVVCPLLCVGSSAIITPVTGSGGSNKRYVYSTINLRGTSVQWWIEGIGGVLFRPFLVRYRLRGESAR